MQELSFFKKKIGVWLHMALLVLLGQITGDTDVLRRMECEMPDNMKSLKKCY